MISSFLTIGQQVLILFILIAVGFFLGKLRLMDAQFSRSLSNLVLTVVVPCITIVSFQRPLETEGLLQFGTVLAISAVIHVINILLARGFLRKRDDFQPLLQFGVIFSNCAFMAYPLQTALLGSSGVFLGSAYVTLYNVLTWTYGIVLLTGERKQLSVKKAVVNPGVIGVLLGLALYLLQISIPETLLTPMQYISNLNTPLPMLIVGYQLSQVDLRRALRSGRCWLSMALRLIVSPLLTLVICLLLGVSSSVTLAVVISSSAPAGASLSMFAARFEKDTELASSIVSTHTLFSALTMPLIVGLAQYLL